MDNHATSPEIDEQTGLLATVDRDDNAGGTAMVPTTAHAWGADIAQRLVADGAGGDAATDLARMVDDGHSLGQWVARYLLVKVCGRSANTVSAKARDLATFMAWFTDHRRHGEISQWVEADTRYFMRHLAKLGRRPATINRALFTLKHFARWVHEQPGGVFARHNSVAESFFGRFKEEFLYRRTWTNKRELYAAAIEYIACFYNLERSHSALGFMSPIAYEASLESRPLAA